MFGGFKTESCEIQCRLCLGRIKLMRNKRIMQLKQSRKEVAELLRNGKQEYARIRVEGVIREQLMLQAYEVLELYMELLAVRAQLVAKSKAIPRDMLEAISSIIYAAERVGDFPELIKLRKMFEGKYGQEYVKEATNDATVAKWQVNQNLIRCLLVEAPQPEDKLATLSDIAQEHGVEWDLSAAARDLLPPDAHPSVAAPLPGQQHAPPPQYGAPAPPQQQYNAPQQQQLQMSPLPAPLPPPPPPVMGGYADANEAAAAAMHAASQAKAAADYAAQFALHQAGLAAPTQPPSNGWLVQQTMGQAGGPASGPPPMPPPPAAAHGAEPLGHDPHAGANGGLSGDTQPHTGRSNEDIQRAYDAALGAPDKHVAAVAASAPPVPDLPRTPSHVASTSAAAAGSGGVAPSAGPSLHLPAPPAGKVQPGAPATGPEDEYEALTRRLEALKRS